ncbi:hypothetical protein COLO4_06383 [Corchorus olitorius]|uniref:Uncharacterized protein n=1 Tax=Corchorus olitorius TaxID=93759 RepID=A0A1R3KN76_9ROSI|nr:hypothetical protein COLO4_06383 [Corchorus olitorius]
MSVRINIAANLAQVSADANSQATTAVSSDAGASASAVIPTHQSVAAVPATVNSSSTSGVSSKRTKTKTDAGKKKTRFSYVDGNNKMHNVSRERSSPLSQQKYSNQRPLTASNLRRAAENKFRKRQVALKINEGAMTTEHVPGLSLRGSQHSGTASGTTTETFKGKQKLLF